jgi:hypothetical protein
MNRNRKRMLIKAKKRREKAKEAFRGEKVARKICFERYI